MNSFPSKKIYLIIGGVLLLAASFFSGYYVALDKRPAIEKVTTITNKEDAKPVAVDFSPFWKAWVLLSDKYVPTHGTSTTPVTDQDKVWGAIAGLTESLGDPYTVFFPPKDAAMFKSEIAGNFEGVGMEIGIKDGILTVISAIKDTPAYRTGVKTGDRIVKIDDKSTADMSVDGAVQLIRGKKGTSIKVTFVREGVKTPIEITMVRDVINIPTIETKKRPDGVFVIKLYSFSENSPVLFKNALQEFVNAHTNKLILDLRGNPGGYLEAATSMASWFLPKGDVVVRENFGQNIPEQSYRSAGYNIFTKDLKMIILVDGGSASAAEILAGALSEHGVAKLVGTKTFGKGSVQELVSLTPDTSLKITIARWLTPNGISISQEGLKPDIEVKADPKQADSANAKDIQLEKAVSILLGK
ncbi:MAG: S41 family peptidase [Candidatus Pacebacteria bacterium]|nr:S41 family peptidase [Candidatus Paceibacterota bacterium]MDD5356756.1 S41 family peptidase [Candidatus Paceibacterota bacterium]